MIRNRDFIFTGLQAWDMSIGSNARDIASEVSNDNRVLYVNTPLTMFSDDLHSLSPDFAYRQSVLAKKSAPVRRIKENLWLVDCPFTLLPTNSLPDGFLFDMVNKLNNRRLFRFVRKVARELGLRDIIHFVDNDIYRSFYGRESLRPSLSVYYRRDNLLAVDFWARHAARLEPLLMAKSDLVACNSTYLAAVAKEYNPHSVDIGQGLDLSPYSISEQRAVPDDISSIPRPIVGYVGYITALRLDADLIYQLARRNENLSFVLVGGEDSVFLKHDLHKLSNVHFLGAKSQAAVADYIASFDICINPQSVNPTTIGNYPRKIDEYLAMGRPTVATRTEAMAMFENYVYLCSSLDQYQEAIEAILSGKAKSTAQAMMSFAQSHTWQSSVGKLYKEIDLMLKP